LKGFCFFVALIPAAFTAPSVKRGGSLWPARLVLSPSRRADNPILPHASPSTATAEIRIFQYQIFRLGSKGGSMLEIYEVSETQGKNGLVPVYVITDGKLYRTINHRQGWSADPDYEMRPDGRLYRTRYHPRGAGDLPDYKFGNDQLIYRTNHHPDGKLDQPVFAIYDG